MYEGKIIYMSALQYDVRKVKGCVIPFKIWIPLVKGIKGTVIYGIFLSIIIKDT